MDIDKDTPPGVSNGNSQDEVWRRSVDPDPRRGRDEETPLEKSRREWVERRREKGLPLVVGLDEETTK